jgi:RNA polymerase sigma factor (sigma-70 family)
MPFARKLARRFLRTTEPLDDLVQVACLGLLNAIERFEPGRGKKFTTALECTMEQAIDAIDAACNYHRHRSTRRRARRRGSLRAGHTVGCEDDAFELAEERQALVAGWATLSDLERRVLGLRLVHRLTQREISHRVGLSQMHVSRVLRRSILRLDAAAVGAVA